jgi:phospholipase/carboxylesterase
MQHVTCVQGIGLISQPGGAVEPGLYSLSRREVVRMGVAGVGASLLSACQVFKSYDGPNITPLLSPVILTRVTAPTGTTLLGTTVPYSSANQEAFMYVPAGYKASVPSAFVLIYHPENLTAFAGISLLQPHADAANIVLLSVDSYGTTWDYMLNEAYGPDVQFSNDALTQAFKVVNVDPTRVAVAGFSDGGTYALTVGRTNGTLFSHVIAFSPSEMLPYTTSGSPKFFISQGLNDTLDDPVDSGEFITSKLTAAGYTVDYVEFNGAHEIPDAIVQQGLAFLAT